tara:strand:- start:5760 stop:6602 length:843 start_codon:yes stop_codon:yes gene_type:complete
MAEQATKRRAPGRPKKAETVANAQPAMPAVEPPVKTKKRTIKRKEVVNENKEYKINKGGGVVYMLPQKGVTVYDEANDTVREIRYCPNEPSIYVDEQSDNAVRQSVAFRMGRLFVPKEKPNLRKFLDMHPQNGPVFKEIDKRRDAEKELEKEFILTDAIARVRDADINDLLPVAIYFGVNINAPVSEIRYNLLTIAKRKTEEFLQSFDSPQVMTRSTIQQARDYQILSVKKNGVFWFDSNNLIVSVPVGQDPMDVMVRFCLTEKGASVLSNLEERLDKLG